MGLGGGRHRTESLTGQGHGEEPIAIYDNHETALYPPSYVGCPPLMPSVLTPSPPPPLYRQQLGNYAELALLTPLLPPSPLKEAARELC